ncbi:MAG: hypothetical protein ACTSUE_04640, partial [Promethearchaeota archaeon]
LLLSVTFREPRFLIENYRKLENIQDLKSLLISKFDEMAIYQEAKGNKKIVKDIDVLLKKGDVSFNLLDAYLQEHKTDAELKILAYIFGLEFQHIPEERGGSTLGTITNLEPAQPEKYVIKIRELAKHVLDGGVIAAFEYHWLALREIGLRIEEFKNDELVNHSLESIESNPHYFKFNNSLSGTIMKVTKRELLRKYFLYCFHLDLELQKSSLPTLSRFLKI